MPRPANIRLVDLVLAGKIPTQPGRRFSPPIDDGISVPVADPTQLPLSLIPKLSKKVRLYTPRMGTYVGKCYLCLKPHVCTKNSALRGHGP